MYGSYDFPFPPPHYHSQELLKSFKDKLSSRKEKMVKEGIVVFGERLLNSQPDRSLLPAFYQDCQSALFRGRGPGKEMVFLISELEESLVQFYKAANRQSEELSLITQRIKDVLVHFYYLIKVLKSTTGAQLSLQVIYKQRINTNREEITNKKKLLSSL